MAWPSDFLIVATEDDTTVTITPPANTTLQANHTNAYTETLDQGQTYQTTFGQNGVDDMTGTLIVSDKPVAVFAGSYLAEVPSWAGAGNPLAQEQLPVEQWGFQALSMGFAGRANGDTYRVLASSTNTTVWTNGVLAGVTNAGQFFEFTIDGPVWFQASQPIQVAHFANGHYFDNATNPNGYQEADPCEILLLPTGHYLETNIVVTGPSLDFLCSQPERQLLTALMNGPQRVRTIIQSMAGRREWGIIPLMIGNPAMVQLGTRLLVLLNSP